MQAFYARTLGLEVTPSDDRKSFAVTAGESVLEFVEDSSQDASYHFAFNVPENQFAQAKRWLAARTPLLRDSETGEDELFFESWNAHAVYFADPAGNIGELIARHTLPIRREGEFAPAQLLHVSEIGLVAPDPDRLARQLIAEFGLSKYGPTSFFVGDELGLFVLPPVGRPWIPRAPAGRGDVPCRGLAARDRRQATPRGFAVCRRSRWSVRAATSGVLPWPKSVSPPSPMSMLRPWRSIQATGYAPAPTAGCCSPGGWLPMFEGSRRFVVWLLTWLALGSMSLGAAAPSEPADTVPADGEWELTVDRELGVGSALPADDALDPMATTPQ
ncbi:MAG: hypothetical protein HC897_14130 [Thermoanaerobaculia bacterium]|nr:hypothetical protein [Thermoanaerobaculia bacterium]